MIALDAILPFSKVEHHAVVSAQGDITVGFEATLPEIFTLSNRDYDAYHHMLVKAIKVLPVRCILHKQDWYVTSSYKSDPDTSGKHFLHQSSERFFSDRNRLEHTCFIFLTLPPSGRNTSSSILSNLLRKSIVPQEVLYPIDLNMLLDAAGQFEQIVKDGGFIRLKRMTDDNLTGTRTEAGVLEKYCCLSDTEHRILKDVEFKSTFKIGDALCKLFTLADAEDLPSLCGSRINYDVYSTDTTKFSTGFASPLGLLLDCNHIYNQYIFLGDPAKTIKALEAKKLRLQSLSAYSRENAVARDATNDFLNEAIQRQRFPVKAHFNILAWSDKLEEAAELNRKVSSALVQLDANPKQETVGVPQIWWAGLPGNAADFPMNDTFDSFLEHAVCFLNLESNYRSSRSTFTIRLGDRVSGWPVQVDLSDEPMLLGYTTNRNKFILGPSGSGKSFFTNHLVRAYHEQGTHVLLVDVGHSYKGLCDLVDGYYFSYSEDNPISFNPFYLVNGDTLDTEKKESIKTLLLALWKKDDEPFRRSEYVALSNALTGFYHFLYEHNDVFPCFNSFYEFLLQEYQHLTGDRKVREKDFDLVNFLYVLRPYYKGGEYDYLLNAAENLDLLNEQFIVFELDAIKDHPILFPAVTLIIMEVFISKMRKLKGVRKMILIEECWKAIAKEGMAEYIKYLFKTVRKFFGEAVVVTQEVEDIISSPIVKQAIINNSDCKILLDQSRYQNKFDDIQKLLGLTEKEKAQVLSLNRANDPKRRYKEVFVSLGGQYSNVYRTEVSLEEYLTYTTEEREKMKVQEYAARYGGLRQGIKMLASEIRNQDHPLIHTS